MKMLKRVHWIFFLLSRKCRCVGSLVVIVIFFSSFLFVVTHRRGLQDRGQMGEFISVLNSSSVIEQRQRQDQRFQQAAFRAFDHHKTGNVYRIPSPTGTEVQAIRLRSGSLRKRGFNLNEFAIVPGCEVQSSPERVVLVYENLGKSDLFPVNGYELVGPVVGMSAYDASDLTTTQPVVKLTVTATQANITVTIPPFQAPKNATPVCVYFGEENPNATMTNPTSTGACSTSRLGFFGLFAKSSELPSVTIPSATGKSSNATKVVVGSVVGVGLLAFLSILTFASVIYTRNWRFATMEYYSDEGETLSTSFVRKFRMPVAGATRTQPTLETEYVA
eukprot:c314_g1_i1 orf=506-1504(-)